LFSIKLVDEYRCKDTDIFLLSAHSELKITSRGIIFEPILGFVTSSIKHQASFTVLSFVFRCLQS